jgi:hypothetical protein
MADKPVPYPKNVAGDFYVEDGCCTGCMVYEHHAPDLIDFDETDLHCFVAKQPTDENELYQAIKITWASEVECIRYRGQNPHVLKRLAEAGVADCCDQKHLIQEIKPLLRNHVTFECPQLQSQLEVADQFKKYILGQNNEYVRYKVSKISLHKSSATFSFSWYEDNYYSVWFNRTEPENTWHIFHSLDCEKMGSRGVSLQIDEWLRGSEDVRNIKWYSNKAWNNFLIEWLETPI